MKKHQGPVPSKLNQGKSILSSGSLPMFLLHLFRIWVLLRQRTISVFRELCKPLLWMLGTKKREVLGFCPSHKGPHFYRAVAYVKPLELVSTGLTSSSSHEPQSRGRERDYGIPHAHPSCQASQVSSTFLPARLQHLASFSQPWSSLDSPGLGCSLSGSTIWWSPS